MREQLKLSGFKIVNVEYVLKNIQCVETYAS